MNDLVSIITPSFNTERFIAETIQSVLSQTYKNWEMIIVDDCSNDSSVNLVKTFKDERIKLIINSENKGAAYSRNLALKLAKGTWIAFLDSDDVWEHNKIEKQLDFMKTKNAAFSYTNYYEIDEKSKKTGIVVTGPKKIGRTLMKMYCFPGCLTVMYNKKIIGDIEISNIKSNNDYALWLKASKVSDCTLLNEKLAYYRVRKGSISSQKLIKLIKSHYVLWRQAERKSVISALVYTFLNIVFGSYKKIRYRRKQK